MEEKLKRLVEALDKIKEICSWVDYDASEADKVVCHVRSIRREIAKVVPEYLDGNEPENRVSL